MEEWWLDKQGSAQRAMSHFPERCVHENRRQMRALPPRVNELVVQSETSLSITLL
jgi:hypothetical protein